MSDMKRIDSDLLDALNSILILNPNHVLFLFLSTFEGCQRFFLLETGCSFPFSDTP